MNISFDFTFMKYLPDAGWVVTSLIANGFVVVVEVKTDVVTGVVVVIILNGLVIFEVDVPNIFVVGAVFGGNVNGAVDVAGAVGNVWLNNPAGGLNVIGPNEFVVFVVLLLLAKVFDAVVVAW